LIRARQRRRTVAFDEAKRLDAAGLEIVRKRAELGLRLVPAIERRL
jgi:DNA transposition AAA+ family ATPase